MLTRKQTKLQQLRIQNQDWNSPEQLELLQKHFQREAKEPRKKKVKQLKLGRKNRTITEQEARTVFYLRHKSLDNSDNVWLTWHEISKALNIPMMTCYNALRKYKRDQFHYLNKRLTRSGRQPDPYKLTHQVKLYLLDHKRLQSWSGYSLLQRVTLLRNEMGVSISPVTLFRFYRKNGIRYISTNFIYQQGLRIDSSILYDFAIKLGALIMNKVPLVYFDEAAFTVWLRRKQTWTSREKPVKMVLNKQRLPGVTVFGAISESLHKPVFSLGKSTNTLEVLDFLKKLRASMNLTSRSKIYVVLDNARAHRSKVVTEYCNHHFIELVFLPGYSPEFNAIEALWGVLKGRVKYRLAHSKDVELTAPAFSNLIQKALDEITVTEQKRAAQFNNRNYLHRMLGEIRQLRFPAPNDEAQIQMIEDAVVDVVDEVEEDDVDYGDNDPNSQDNSSQSEDKVEQQAMSPLLADQSFDQKFFLGDLGGNDNNQPPEVNTNQAANESYDYVLAMLNNDNNQIRNEENEDEISAFEKYKFD